MRSAAARKEAMQAKAKRRGRSDESGGAEGPGYKGKTLFFSSKL